ncbi:MAG: DUF4405 domain-containing protein [Anaerolineae bacterium]|nr:DUF4405 domain-containing protein [Anaerolineae bacterium]
MKLSKARVNLLLDVAIGIGFLAVAVSGLVLMFALPNGGYQGGRNALYGQSFVFDRHTWIAVHDWFGLVITAGVLGHVALHWRWIVCMVRKLWQDAFQSPPEAAPAQECPA